MAYSLITGVTGLLGRYLLRDLGGGDRPLAVIARPSKGVSARLRVDSILTRWEKQLGYSLPRPVVLTGDLTKPNLGLTQIDLDWIAGHCQTVIHNAASLRFVGKDREGEPWLSNLTGTRHLLDVCSATGIRDCYYVSTAYVCGQRTGLVLEDELDVGQEPGNDYEASKLAAEKLVRESTLFQNVTVFRPAIIAGDSRTGYTNTFHGFYFPLKLSAYWGALSPADTEFDLLGLFRSMGLTGDETKNFVPVDWVSEMIAQVIERPNLAGRTYHLTSDHPVTVAEMTQVMIEATRGRSTAKLTEQSRAKLIPASSFQNQFRTQMETYQSYLRDDARFSTSNTRQVPNSLPCPRVDDVMMRRWCRFAMEHKFVAPDAECETLEWDASEFLNDFSSHPNSDRAIGLQINGPGGGQWQVDWTANRIGGVQPGISNGCRMIVYLNAKTFRTLTLKQCTPTQALAAGRVLCEGDIENPTQFLEQLINLEPTT